MKFRNLLIGSMVIVLASCGTEQKDSMDVGSSIETFEMLESVFDGPYNQYAIKDGMDEVFAMYNLDAKQSNYLKIGNALVDFKKESNGSFREMDIINHMIEANTGEGGVSFDEQFNKSVRTLKRELAEK
ncbi:MAG: hypothetical protein COB88_08345 [Flavobacteriales bacterium]|nr:MAG: hypothetical protein COB88_08345 [Flavobacteriales bacterium]